MEGGGFHWGSEGSQRPGVKPIDWAVCFRGEPWGWQRARDDAEMDAQLEGASVSDKGLHLQVRGEGPESKPD